MTLLTEPTRIVLAKGQPVPNDPSFAFNSLLLHGDGANGSTVITDSSGSPKPVTAVGNTQISTAQSKFGGASIAFDGAGDYLTLPGGAAFEFGTDSFTVELWYRPASLTGQKVLLDTRATGLSLIANRWIIYTDGSSLSVAVAGAIYTSGTLSLNTWHFIAVSRSGTTTRIFLDGTQIGSNISDSINYGVGAARPIIGADGNNPNVLNINGYIDDLRITKGVARYTANFTPPTAPFPDF